MPSVSQRLRNGETLDWFALTYEEKIEVWKLSVTVNPFTPSFSKFCWHMEWLVRNR